MKRTILIIVGIVIIAIALISYWPKQSEYFDGCSLVEAEDDLNSFTDSQVANWLRDLIELEYSDVSAKYLETRLQETEIRGVKEILASYNLLRDGSEVEGASFTPMLEFVVGVDGQAFILSMLHKAPIFKVDAPESCRFELIPVEKGRDGYWHIQTGKKTRRFISDELYQDIENYIKSLPASPDGLRKEYDVKIRAHQEIRDALKSKDSKMFY